MCESRLDRTVRRLASALALVCLTATPAAAHELSGREASRGGLPWIDGFVWLGLAVTALGYGLGVRRVWRRAGVGAGVRPRELVCFLAAIVVIGAALSTPIIEAAAADLSAHMVQHMLLMLVAAPLLALGAPGVALSWAFAGPRGAVRAAHRFTRTVRRGVTHPLTAFSVYGAALWVWHAPVFYDAALRHDSVHAVQHGCFLGAGCLFWWSMLAGRYGRAGYGAAVLYVFLTAVHSGVLGALMFIAPSAWYGTYAARGGAAALADQQMAGLLMWIPSALVFIGAGLSLLAVWILDSDRRAYGGG